MTVKADWSFAMPSIKVIELESQLAKLPEIESVEIASQLKDDHASLLLCALGFEPRCLAVPQALAMAGFACERAIYFEYQSNPQENDANRSALVSQLSSISASVESLDSDAPEFTQRLRSLFRDLSRSEQPAKVLIDISVFGNRLAFKLYAVLLDARIDVTILYAEAAVYHPTHDEYIRNPKQWGAEEFGLERGVSSISISPEQPGRFLDRLPDFVMVFPAFSPDRAKAALEWIDPSLISPNSNVKWFIGEPHLDADYWRMDAVRSHHLISAETPQMQVSTFSYKDTLRALHASCETQAERFNLTLVPLGSKLQAFGAALCCFVHPEVRVMFAVPREYNAATYSEGTKAFWKIAVGRTEAVRSALLDVGTLEILDEI